MAISQSIVDRFWSKVDRSGGPEACHPWIGRLQDGYGRFDCYSKSFGAHRMAFEFANGPIPLGLLVCHTCDYPACCNARHLLVGTDSDNVADRDRKGRRRCLSGDQHPSRLHPETRPRGENHKRAKLTNVQVLAIRADTRQQRVIAKEYGVSKIVVWLILHRRTWKHLP